MSYITGGCHCGAIRFDISTDIKTAVNCHCTFCRKLNGSAFSSMVAVPSNFVRFTCGEDQLNKYVASDDVQKHFCRLCGSPIFNTNKEFPAFHMFFLGALDDHLELQPVANISCSDKLSWVSSIDSIKSFEGDMDMNA